MKSFLMLVAFVFLIVFAIVKSREVSRSKIDLSTPNYPPKNKADSAYFKENPDKIPLSDAEVKANQAKKDSIDKIPTINYDVQALSEVKREPKVKEAMLNGTILYVSVVSDGSDRSGYADYICEVVRNSKIERVKVVEYGSTNNPNKDNAYGVLLGSAKCK